MEKRELAAKKARLAAAEIANFSTHACGEIFFPVILFISLIVIKN